MQAKVLGVLAGRDMPLNLIRTWAESADVLLAADAGADALLAAGVPPQVVIGDLDSTARREEWESDSPPAGPRLVHDPGQETTDCDKLLAFAAREGHAAITLIAVEGDRLDHVLATLHSAAKAPIRVRVALRTGVGWILTSGEEVTVRTMPGRLISLLPLAPSEGVSFSGVEWPLERSELAPLGKTSVSNRATSDEVTASVREGSVFLYVELPEVEAPLW